VATQSLIPSFEAKELHSADITASEVFEALKNELEAIKRLTDPQKCDAKYLPFLAYSFGVDFWDEDLSESEKRALIQKSLKLHRHKGTLWAIEQVFEALNIKASVKEWFDYDGEPYHFKLDLSLTDREITPKLIEKLKHYVNIFKNVRSILDELILSYLQSQNVVVGSGGVGEASTYSKMVDGYRESVKNLYSFGGMGAVGETFGNTKMMDYEEMSRGLYKIYGSGGVGEVLAYAVMEV